MRSEYNYEPVDLEDELFLSEAPIELMQHLIKSQFETPLEDNNRDFIQSFITKYLFTKENSLDEDLVMLENNRDGFLSFMIKTFEDFLNVGFVDFEDKDNENQHEILHLTYRFFIKNIKKNFVNSIYNYINDNRDYILSSYSSNKDVTTLTFKDEIDDDFDIITLSNLCSIIDDILERFKELQTVDEFFNLCRGDKLSVELEFVSAKYEDMELTGNFIEKYVEMADDEYFKSEIHTKLRNKILKKYPFRTKKSKKKELKELKGED